MLILKLVTNVLIKVNVIIFTNADGVIIAPPNEFEKLLEKGESATKRERKLFAKIEEGNLRKEPLFPENKVEILIKKEQKSRVLLVRRLYRRT